MNNTKNIIPFINFVIPSSISSSIIIKMSKNSLSTSPAMDFGLKPVSPTTQPELTRTVSETTLVDPNQKSSLPKEYTKDKGLGVCPFDCTRHMEQSLPLFSLTHYV